MVKLLISAGAHVNTVDKSDNTPLMLSAWMGYKEVVNILLDNGEPARNAPASLDEQGQEILGIQDLGGYSDVKVRRKK